MTLEQVLVGIFLAMILLITAVSRALAARSTDETAGDRTPRTPEPRPFPARIPRRSPARANEPRRRLDDRAFARLPPMTPANRRSRGLRLILREMRRGIVLMTVLGPCRSLEPPDLVSMKAG